MPDDAAPLVDVRDIVRLVGQGAFQRGREYAKAGAVSEIVWDDESGLLSSTVQGSLEHPYRCHIELAPARDGYHRAVSGNCSCPMLADCKHVAATLMECNTVHLQTNGVGGVTAARALSKVTGPRAAPDVAAEPAWRSSVAALTTAAATSDAPVIAGAGIVPMALMVQLREQMPQARSRWNTGPVAKPATASTDPSAEVKLGIRPAVLSDTGNWVLGTSTWNTLAFQLNRHNLNPQHHRWFAQFAGLYQATRELYGRETDWYYLDDFTSPLLWNLLHQAADIGIAVVSGKKDSPVAVGTEAAIAMEVSAASGGDLHLDPVLRVDGHARSVEAAGAIGDHGVYTWSFAPRLEIALAPTRTPITPEQRRLLGIDGAVVVPAADADEFLTEFYPRLRRGIEITTPDASVLLPEIVPPVLVATVTFGEKQSLALAWDWEYTTGATTRRLPLAGAEEGRDHAAELSALSAVARVVDDAPVLMNAALMNAALMNAAPMNAAPTNLAGLAAAEFSTTVLPALEEAARASDGTLRVDIVGDRPDYRELLEVPTLTVTTVETEQRDWFDLGVIVTVDGRKVPFGPLFTALTRGQKKLLLVDNSYLSLEQPVFAELKALIDEASSLAEWETTPRISRYQASLWADFEDLADETEQAVSWRGTVARLNALESVERTPLPAGLSATLRPYQHDGFDWLAFLWQHGLGGVLADDMGLGKTLQTLALIAHTRSAAPADGRLPFLVVAPTSVVSNWVSEAQRFTPGLVVRGITATNAKSRTSVAHDVRGADVVVTSYALFRLDLAAYQDEQWAGLVLDEAQFVKNPASKAHQAAVELDAPFKLAITGTPMENSLMDLWSLFQIVAPGLFPSGRRFTDDYVKPITGGAAGESDRSAELLARLRRRIRPLMMRRTKDLVATELPAKQEQVLRIDLAPSHRSLYDTFLQKERQKLLGLLADMDKNRFIVFRSLTLLRMLSLDASLVDEKYSDIPSSKLDALFEQLDDVVAEGHRALVFSQFTSFLKKAAARLDAAGVPYEYLDGSTLKRADVIARFKKGDAPVFLISLKAGGFGLNLTEADYVFMLDPWWNPAAESQAIDRTHRIGQTKSVMVYRMVSTGTIEEKVMALKEQKARLFDAVMDDDAVFSSALTADDVRGLLEA